MESSRPDVIDDVIEEVSEPVSPQENDYNPSAAHPSALSNLMRERLSPSRVGGKSQTSSYGESDQQSGPSVFIDDVDIGETTEASPLLPRERLPGRSYSSHQKDTRLPGPLKLHLKSRWAKIKYEYRSMVYTASHPKDWDVKQLVHDGSGAVAAVFLGLLLNILDALSYGKLCWMYSHLERLLIRT
jgi:hypothetical protein